jgi:polyphosphate kinase
MDAPSPFINRELSWLEFNHRVLEEALDPSTPLLERLKFLAITASNLDEFFMVRVGSLLLLAEGGRRSRDVCGMTVEQQLTAVARRCRAMAEEQQACFLDDVEARMREAGIRRLAASEWTPDLYDYLKGVFEHDIYPVLTPVAVESSEDFPSLPGLGLNLLARLKAGKDAGRKPRFAVVALPRKLGRFITLPLEAGHNYVLIEDVVGTFVERLFPGEPVAEWTPFRITRNADMSVREDLAGDLLESMKEVLLERKQSGCVRLEVADAISKSSRSFLQSVLNVRDDLILSFRSPIDLSSYFGLSRMTGFDELRDKPWPPQRHPDVQPNESIFEAIARGDLLLFHPYESFDPAVRLVEEAADDPDVLAIKQILYRTSDRSPVVAALARAAGREKHVTAIVELKARFDEARNIGWAQDLEQTGVQVIYGIKGLKTHAKICIVVRREAGGIRRYVHFGTGNYNEITARIYSDVSYMTCREDYGADATAFFNMITGYSQPVAFQRLEAAPIGLRARLLDLIGGEIERHQQGQPGHIMAKVNSLVDTELVEALYRASQAGVKIELNVRGICCLRPGVPGLSENIRVVSIVDRFLEHARILCFGRGGEPLVLISSADWMPRNLDRRVELLVAVEDERSRNRLIGILRTCLADNTKARELGSDGRYTRRLPAQGESALRAQESFYEEARERARVQDKPASFVFEPQRPAGGS